MSWAVIQDPATQIPCPVNVNVAMFNTLCYCYCDGSRRNLGLNCGTSHRLRQIVFDD